MAQVVRGKASVHGVAGSFDVILYPVAQSMRFSQNFELDIAKDNQGDDAAWRTSNETYDLDMGMKLLGDTIAHAKAGAAMLAPLAAVAVSSGDAAIANGTYQVMNGAEIDLGNTKIGDITFKLRRYANSTQNTLFTTTPS